MNNEVLEATKNSHYANKLRHYLQRREVITEYAKVCIGELEFKLDSVELENATTQINTNKQEVLNNITQAKTTATSEINEAKK